MMGFPIIPEFVQCFIEIFLISILFILILKNYNYKLILKQRPSKTRIYIIFISFSICGIDLMISTIKGIFPMINFIVRSFLIIFLSKKLRIQWIKLLKIIYLTRNLIFILFLDILFFAVIGHILFVSDDFTTLFSSIDNILVMLTTNNFPDVMLKTFPQSKFSVFYFIPFMLISYIVIIALLKALYYSNYFEINKDEVLTFLNEISGFKLYANENSEKINLQKKLNNFEISFNENNLRKIMTLNKKSSNDNGHYFSNIDENIIKEEDEKKERENSLEGPIEVNIQVEDFNKRMNFDFHNLNLDEECSISRESLLEDYDKITDREREELFNYLKIIYSNFSLTKKEIKIIKKIIYFNSEKKRIEKLQKKTSFKKQVFDKSQIQFKKDLTDLSTYKDLSPFNQTQLLNEHTNTLNEIHKLYFSRQSTFVEDFDEKNISKLQAQIDPSKKLKELNKFLLSENENIFSDNKLLNFTRRKYFEIILNVLNIMSIFFLYFDINYNYLYIATVVHMCFCFYFIYEFIQFLNYYSFKKMLRIHFFHSLILLISIVGFISNLILLVCIALFSLNFLEEDFLKLNFYFTLKKIAESFVLLRALRIFILLNKYKEFYTIFTTIHNLRGIFSSIIWTLISFCFIFTTISMILFGGKVHKDRFKDNVLIPENYHNLNFNDYASGFMFCFAMIVINNMNNIFDDLSLIYSRYMKLYFSIFFFLGIILIMNITQMLILEMYLNIKDTFSTLSGQKGFVKKNYRAKRISILVE